jgi:hypothetical protein
MVAAAASTPWAAAIAAATGTPFPPPGAASALPGTSGVGVIWKVMETWIPEEAGRAAEAAGRKWNPDQDDNDDDDSRRVERDRARAHSDSGQGEGGSSGGGRTGHGNSAANVSQEAATRSGERGSRPSGEAEAGARGGRAVSPRRGGGGELDLSSWGDVVPSEPDGRAGYLPMPRCAG